jgi:hypothetical protein
MMHAMAVYRAYSCFKFGALISDSDIRIANRATINPALLNDKDT